MSLCDQSDNDQTDLPRDETAVASGLSSSERAGGLKTHGWAAVSLAALVIGLYWPTVGFDFVNWDDPWYIVKNPLIKSWHPVNLFQMATQVAIKNYAPVTMFSYLVDHTLWGLSPGGFHFTNFLLHVINTILVYALLVQLTQSQFVGWSAAALFAVHPVQIESVAWISSRKGLLSGTWILASLICWLRPQPSPRQEGYGLLFFVLGLLSKATAIVVPFVVLAYDLLVRRQPLSTALPRQLIPGFLSFCLLLVTMSAQTTEFGGVRSHMGLGKVEILAVDAVILWRYVGKLINPNNLCVLYDPPISGIAVWVALAAAGWMVVAFGVSRCRKRFPLIALAAISFIAFLLPVLNLFPITTLMNDRYLYLPSIPLFALVAAGLRRVCIQNTIAYASVAAAVLVFGQTTRAHLPVWRNPLALWEHTVEHVPQLPVAQIQLANTLHTLGRDREAVSVLETALETCNPDPSDRKRIDRKLADWPGGGDQGSGASRQKYNGDVVPAPAPDFRPPTHHQHTWPHVENGASCR